MVTLHRKIWILVAAVSCALASCSGTPLSPVEDSAPEEVKYASEAGREVREIPGIYEYTRGWIEYNDFKELLYQEKEKDKTSYRDLPDLLQKKKEQGAEVDAFTLAQMEKHLNAAVEYFKATTEKSPEYEQAFLYLGLSYYQLQRYEDALSALHTVVQIHPEAANTRLTMAMCYLNMGKKKEALECANKALKIDPDNRDAQLFIQRIEQSLR